jgi:hypothetical protein
VNLRRIRLPLATALLGFASATAILRNSVRAEDDESMLDKLRVIAAYSQAATPGEEHEKLCEYAGDWTFEATTFLGPAPETSKGTARFEPILGGRYVVQKTQGKMLGQPFDGFGLNGFDNVTREYFTFWADSWSTNVYEMRGARPKEGEPLVLSGQARDAMSPEGRPWRMVQSWIEDDEFRLEVFDTLERDGKPTEVKAAELVYRRVK